MRYEGIDAGLDRFRNTLRRLLDVAAVPLARALARAHVTPNQVSIFGFLMNLVAAGFVLNGDLFVAGVVYLFAGCMDLLDGTLARVTGRANRFGALLDSTVDRVSEGVIFAAIAYRFAMEGEGALVALAVIAFLGSVLISYVRARAEGLGAECEVGVVTRAERVVLLTVGLLANLLEWAILALVILTILTVIQRLHHVYKQFAQTPEEQADPRQEPPA